LRTGVDHIAGAVLVLHQHGDAGQEVPDHLLGAEAEHQPGDARPGQQGPEPKPEHMQH
jgi:hypothetical protein